MDYIVVDVTLLTRCCDASSQAYPAPKNASVTSLAADLGSQCCTRHWSVLYIYIVKSPIIPSLAIIRFIIYASLPRILYNSRVYITCTPVRYTSLMGEKESHKRIGVRRKLRSAIFVALSIVRSDYIHNFFFIRFSRKILGTFARLALFFGGAAKCLIYIYIFARSK